jgi:hypothetical protein
MPPPDFRSAPLRLAGLKPQLLAVPGLWPAQPRPRIHPYDGKGPGPTEYYMQQYELSNLPVLATDPYAHVEHEVEPSGAEVLLSAVSSEIRDAFAIFFSFLVLFAFGTYKVVKSLFPILISGLKSLKRFAEIIAGRTKQTFNTVFALENIWAIIVSNLIL